MGRTYACPREQFLTDVERHDMSIIRDDDVHRHIRFKRPDSGTYYFDVITWPGSLVISGDCGTYAFQRTTDMFKFFRADQDRPGEINPSYWAEKVTAADMHGRVQEFKWATFEADIADHLQQAFDGHENAPRAAKIAADVKTELQWVEQDEAGAIGFIRDYQCDGWSFVDWERRSREYTFRFCWNLHAIVWAIARYDALKLAGKLAANDDGSERIAA